MVKWIPDRTGRFPERPHYEPREIDNEGERIAIQLLTKVHGRVDYPIVTDDLEKLIESKARDLDMYADLSFGRRRGDAVRTAHEAVRRDFCPTFGSRQSKESAAHDARARIRTRPFS